MTRSQAKTLALFLAEEGKDFSSIVEAVSAAQNYEGLSDDTIDEIVTKALVSVNE